MIRLITATAVAALLAVALPFTSASAQGGPSRGVSVSETNAIYYAWGADDDVARENALAKCRDEEGRRNCQDTLPKAIGVASYWSFVFAMCDGDLLVAGTEFGDSQMGMATIRNKVSSSVWRTCRYNRTVAGVGGNIPTRAQGR